MRNCCAKRSEQLPSAHA